MYVPANADWIGWFIGLCAVLLATVFYFKSKVVAQLSFQWRGRHLVGGAEADLPAEVAITYKGTNVPRLSSAEVIFWNSGNSTVRGLDIVEADPLRIVLSGDAHILRITINAVTREVNAFAATVHPEKPNEAVCSFDFLDKGDGVRLELLHTSKRRKPKIVGTIRGLPSGVHDCGRIARMSLALAGFTRLQSRRVIKAFNVGVVTLGFATALVGALGPAVEAVYHTKVHWLPAPPISTKVRLALVLAGVTYMLPGLFALWTNRRRFPRILSDDD